jgi:hypothetical protein
LRRIVEFLNEQMRPAEVLAIEVEQFTSPGGVRTLVPKLLGDTERAQAAKSVAPAPQPISEQEWLNSLEEAKGTVARATAERAIAWFKAIGFVVGITDSHDAISARLTRPTGKPTWPFFIRKSTGKLELSLQYLKSDPTYASDDSRQQLLELMKRSVDVPITTTKLTGWPAISLEDAAKDEIWRQFQAIATEVKTRVESGIPA